MVRFRDFPIRQKLTLFIMLASLLALAMAVLAVVGYEVFTFKKRAVNDVSILADMIDVSTAAALVFGDPPAAQETLNTLKAEREIASACIYTADGTIVARYVRPDLKDVQFPTVQPEGERFENRDLVLFRRITSKGDPVGTVYLRYDLRMAYARAPHYTFILAGVLVVLLSLTWLLSTVLQRIISAPILRLARAARQFTENKDYSVRAVKETNDEIGQLTDTFNEMLQTIAARENALSQANGELGHELAERKRAEEALRESEAKLRKHADDLEIRVTDRTASLQETIRSLEGVLYHVAHDLRAPLRAMQGFITLLLDEYAPNLDATGKSYAKKVSSAAIRMDGLIQDLLQYGRLGHMDLPCEPVDLSGRIAAVLNYLAEEIKSTGGEVKVAEPLPQVRANVKVLDQVLSNLVGNALKFVEPGVSPQIRIGSELRAETVRLWIQDNGIGIDAAHHERVFGVFERLNGTDAYPGSGIGLAIVRKGVERMGGRVGVESKLGAGSRFWLDLPLSRKKT